MALILGIDVSGKLGLVTISEEGKEIDFLVNPEPMQHASFLQPAIKTLLKRNSRKLEQFHAISIVNGPGSYTGLRVGLASAKGLCFALGLPLITVNSLQLIALAAQQAIKMENLKTFSNSGMDKTNRSENQALYCSMIDARRLEVFFGLYNEQNQALINPTTGIIDVNFLNTQLASNTIVFTGSGAAKWQNTCTHENAIFLPEPPLNDAFCQLSHELFKQLKFADLKLADPFYCKSFYQPTGSLKS